MANQNVYFDINIDGIIVMEEADVVRKTAENFHALCTGEKDLVRLPMCHSTLHVPDFINHNGTGGKSIYGEKFEDENFTLKHKARGILSMTDAGPNTNNSQFFICHDKIPR